MGKEIQESALLPLRVEQAKIDISQQHRIDDVKLITAEVEEHIHGTIKAINEALPKISAAVAAAASKYDDAVEVGHKAAIKKIEKSFSKLLTSMKSSGFKEVSVAATFDHNARDTWIFNLEMRQGSSHRNIVLGDINTSTSIPAPVSKKVISLRKEQARLTVIMSEAQKKLLELTRESQDMSRVERRGQAAVIRQARLATPQGKVVVSNLEKEVDKYCSPMLKYSSGLNDFLKALPAPKSK